ANLCPFLRHSRDGANIPCAAGREDCQGTAARVELASDGMGSTAGATGPRRLLGRRADGASDCGPGGTGALPTDLGLTVAISMSGMVPGCQVRNLESLEPSVCAGGWGLVRAQHVHSGRPDVWLSNRAVRLSARALRSSLALRLQGSVRTMDSPQLAAG